MRPEMPQWHVADRRYAEVDRPTAQAWLDRYVEAWKTYDPADIGPLWSPDSVWIYPFGVRARGREAIVAEWMAEKDLFTDGGYDAHYEPIAIDGDLVVAHGRTSFFDPVTFEPITRYDNVWVLRFDADDPSLCAEFHEWYSRHPADEHD